MWTTGWCGGSALTSSPTSFQGSSPNGDKDEEINPSVGGGLLLLERQECDHTNRTPTIITSHMKIASRARSAAALSATLFFCLSGVEAKADLGDADVSIATPSSTTTLSRSYVGKCGKSQQKCKIQFSEGKLIINDSDGIYREQLVRVDTSRTCRQKSILLPFVTTCYGEQLDYDYMIHYKDSDENQRSALISFWPGYIRQKISEKKGFAASLDAWRSDTTPYMAKEMQNRKAQNLSNSCTDEFIAYECSWSKYLELNPHMAEWAKSNPELAQERMERLKLLP